MGHQQNPGAVTWNNYDVSSSQGLKTMASGAGPTQNASSCNCDVVDPDIGVKVYDPVVKAYVYEVDENTGFKGTSGTASEKQITNIMQPVNRKQWGAVDNTRALQSKYGV